MLAPAPSGDSRSEFDGDWTSSRVDGCASADQQHRGASLTNQLVGHAAQEPATNPIPAMGGHHYQVRRRDGVKERDGRAAGEELNRGGDVLVAERLGSRLEILSGLAARVIPGLGIRGRRGNTGLDACAHEVIVEDAEEMDGDAEIASDSCRDR